jgi:hypothetical protein
MAKAQSDEEMEAIRLKYDFTVQQFQTICQRNDFKREYTTWKQALIREGESFRLKARALAEAHLPEMHRLLASDLTSPNVKLSIFQYLTKVAELEPAPQATTTPSSQAPTKLLIQWGDNSGQIALQVGGNNE